jgi:hypothetical protein
MVRLGITEAIHSGEVLEGAAGVSVGQRLQQHAAIEDEQPLVMD